MLAAEDILVTILLGKFNQPFLLFFPSFLSLFLRLDLESVTSASLSLTGSIIATVTNVGRKDTREARGTADADGRDALFLFFNAHGTPFAQYRLTTKAYQYSS